MIELFPWWVGSFLLVFYFGFGAVVGLVAVNVAVTMANRGAAKWSPKDRVVMSIVGFITGGVVSFVILSSVVE